MRAANYANPISSANAAESVTPAPSPAASPTPVPPSLQGPGVGTTALGVPNYTGLPPGVSTQAPNSANGLPTSIYPSGAGPSPIAMPYAAGQGPMTLSRGPNGPNLSGDLGPGGPNTVRGVDESGSPIWETDPRLPNFNNLPATGAGGGRRARVPATARANVPPAAATPNDRFIAMPYGTAQRGPGSTPIITALNLGGLFGGGGNTAVAPTGGGALAKNSSLARAQDLPLSPTQRAILKAKRADQIAGASLKQRYS